MCKMFEDKEQSISSNQKSSEHRPEHGDTVFAVSFPKSSSPRLTENSRSEASTNREGHVGVERGGGIECLRATIARDVAQVSVVANVACWVPPSPNGGTRATEAGLCAEGGVFVHLLGTVIGVDIEHEIDVAQVATGSVNTFQGIASTVSEASHDLPAGLLLEGSAARRRDNLGANCGAVV